MAEIELTDEQYGLLEKQKQFHLVKDGESYDILLLEGLGTHYASIQRNGKWIAWLPSRKNSKERIVLDVKDVLEYHNMKKEPFCFICGRKKEELGSKETLTCDHIVQLVDGGNDEVQNAQVLCSACHKLKNWVVLYVVKHQRRNEGTQDV